MCGIVGYIGTLPAAPLLLEGLEKLKYRGYDSAGVALVGDKGIDIHKTKGHVQDLTACMKGGVDMPQTVGIGHTRWATHGKPSDVNAHPHRSQNGTFAVLHNGIIENYLLLRQQLQEEGVTFLSETDTEVIPHLIEKYYAGECRGDFLGAVRRAVRDLKGSYALEILCADRPGELVAVRNASPMILGLAESGVFVASDVPAILSQTRRVIRLDDHDVVHMTRDGFQVYDGDGNPVEKDVQQIDWDVDAAQKDGYDHFMLKEIYEQPAAVRKTVAYCLDGAGNITLGGVTLTPDYLATVRRVYIVACGSAYHAGVVGKYVLEKLARLPVEVDLASEFRYRDPLVGRDTLVVIISQSGETEDSKTALKEARKRGARVLSIVNVVGSSIAVDSDDVIYTQAGPEIAVATTKAYSAQLATLYLIALHIARARGSIDAAEQARLLAVILRLPEQMEAVLAAAPEIEALAPAYAQVEHAYFIGRGVDYAVALEASLKLKEISYVHSEAYAAGELKHGTISLIEEGTPVVGLACCERLLDKTLSNLVEVKSRGARVLLVATEGHAGVEREMDDVLHVPATDELFTPSLEVIPLQLLSYYVAKERGCSVDTPRNLAKSVTVE